MSSKVSILMGIYNCAATLPEAIESILEQTYENWELIMCNDGSTDDSKAVAERYCAMYPGKIKLLENPRNLGLNKTLNHCLAHAEGDYIARMDGDDVSLPERLAVEAKFLDNNPEYAIVSMPMIYFDENGAWGRGSAVEKPDKMAFVAGTPFCHGPCMVRREAYEAVCGYSEDKMTMRAEDYNLWFRMYAEGYKGYNIQVSYYKMRDDMNAYHRRKFRFCINEAFVRLNGYKMLKLPLWTYVYALRPLIVGLLPKSLYLYLHHKRQR